MLPRNRLFDRSTAIDGMLCTRSLPSTWSIVKKSLVMLTGALQVAPLSVDRATPMLLVKKSGNRDHATYAFGDPCPANRGIDPWPSTSVAATMRRADQVGGVAVAMSSENVVEISTPPAAAGVKLDQLMIARPLSGSTSMNSLSAS